MKSSTVMVLGLLGVAVSLSAASGCSLMKKKAGKPGEACEKAGAVVCNDKKTALVCADGKWEEMPCRANTGCMSTGAENDNCTNHNYEVNEPCFEQGTTYQCTVDKKAMLTCTSGRWKVVEKCLGQNGCQANAKGARCDMSVAADGDPCAKESKDTYSCTEDKKIMLRCDGAKMVPHAKCPGMHGCRKQFDKIECNGQQPL